MHPESRQKTWHIWCAKADLDSTDTWVQMVEPMEFPSGPLCHILSNCLVSKTLVFLLLRSTLTGTSHFCILGKFDDNTFFVFDSYGAVRSPLTMLLKLAAPSGSFICLNTCSWQITGRNCGLYCLIMMHAWFSDFKIARGYKTPREMLEVMNAIKFLRCNGDFSQNDSYAFQYASLQHVGEEFYDQSFAYSRNEFYAFQHTLDISHTI